MRVAVMATSMVVMLLLGGIVPMPTMAAPSCTFVGSSGRDVYAGNRNGEVVCLLGGDDYAHGNGGRDRIRGGPGSDSLVAGQGRDKLKGGPGSDRLFATDQRTSNDVVRGGAGFDQCFADPGDLVRGCEGVQRGNTALTTEALTVNSFDVTEIAEDALEVLPSPTLPLDSSAPPLATVPPTCPHPADPACD